MEGTKEDKQTEQPPFLGSWTAIYWFLMGNLAVFILLFYILTRYFS